MGRVRALVVVLLICAAEAFGGNAPWVQVKSPNFTVITDAGEKKGRDTALHFEQMRAVFGTLFAKAKINSSQPLYILAFRNTKEFRALCPLWKGRPEELAGFFQPGNGVTYIALDLSTENKWGTVFHEYGHFLLNSNTVEELPPWFNEGFAEYFSTVRIEGNSFIFGDIPQGHSLILQQYQWLPVDQLFSVRHDSSFYNERNQQTIFYAESWLAVAHYWFNTNQPKQVPTFLALYNQRVPVDEAIQKAFGMDAKALDKELHKFYAMGKLGLRKGPMPEGMDKVTMTVSSVDDIDARARVAEVKLQTKDHQQEGVQEFEEIVKEKADHPIALRGLAYAALRSGDKHKAADYFRKAASVQSEDPHIYYFSAALLAQMDAQSNPEYQAEMQKNLERAVQLDPNFADAYGMLALAYTWAGKHDEAIAPAEKAVQLSPRNDQWAMNLAGFYANAKRYDDALNVLQRLTKSANPALAQQAATMFTSLSDYKAKMADYEKWQKERDEQEKAAEQREAAENRDAAENGAAQEGPPGAPKLQRRVTTSGRMTEAAVLNYFEGMLKGANCGSKATTFTVLSKPSALTLVAQDVQQVSFSGKGTFSCGMHDVKVKGFYSKKATSNQLVALEFVEDGSGK
ncbi:MAG: tetratricopeptide repeat protein [Terriglobales bacterium]